MADHRVRLAALPNQAGQFPGHMRKREGRLGHQRQTLPRVVIDHAQDAEAPATDQAVGDEVERPSLVRFIWPWLFTAAFGEQMHLTALDQ